MTNDHIQMEIKMPTPSQQSPAPSKAPTQDIKGYGCSLHLQNQDREPKFGPWVCQRTVNIFKSRSRYQTPVRNLQCPPKPQMRTLKKWMFLHPQNQEREPKFRSWVYQRPVTISKSRSKFQTPVRNLKYPPKPQTWTKRTWIFFAPSKSR